MPSAAPITSQRTLEDVSSASTPAERTTSNHSLSYSIRHGAPLHFFTDPPAEEEVGLSSSRENISGLPPRTAESSDTAVGGDSEKRDGLQGDQASSQDEFLWVEFEERDSRNPYHFSRGRKWAMTLVAVCQFRIHPAQP